MTETLEPDCRQLSRMLGKMRLALCFITCLAAGTISAAPERSVQSVKCADVPSAVRKAAEARIAESATPPACERIAEGRNVLYEVKVTTHAGRMQEWVYRTDGSLEESEEEIPESEVPEAARQAIRQKVGSGQLRKTDRIQRGQQVLFEGEYTVNGAKAKVIVDASGRITR